MVSCNEDCSSGIIKSDRKSQSISESYIEQWILKERVWIIYFNWLAGFGIGNWPIWGVIPVGYWLMMYQNHRGIGQLCNYAPFSYKINFHQIDEKKIISSIQTRLGNIEKLNLGEDRDSPLKKHLRVSDFL